MTRTIEWAIFGQTGKWRHRIGLKISQKHCDKRKLFYGGNRSAQIYKERYKGFKTIRKDKLREWILAEMLRLLKFNNSKWYLMMVKELSINISYFNFTKIDDYIVLLQKLHPLVRNFVRECFYNHYFLNFGLYCK